MMKHEEILSLARQYHQGVVEMTTKVNIEEHLGSCEECRILYGRWKLEEPPPGFIKAVMADLPFADWEKPVRILSKPFQLWGTVAAAILISIVFWKPERDWVNADKYFVWSEQGSSISTSEIRGGGHHE